MSWLLGGWLVTALAVAWEYYHTPELEWHD